MAVEKDGSSVAYYRIYTDGSCYPNPHGFGGAAAIILRYCDKSHGWIKIASVGKSLVDCTNNQAELWAVIIGIRKLHKVKAALSYSIVEILSDSKYVIEGATGRWRICSNKDLWSMLLIARLDSRIKWTWLRGHDGNHWNENCDELSNKYRLRAMKNYKPQKTVEQIIREKE